MKEDKVLRIYPNSMKETLKYDKDFCFIDFFSYKRELTSGKTIFIINLLIRRILNTERYILM